MSKLIGVALVILAVVAYYGKEIIGAVISVVAALVLLFASKDASQKNLQKFVNSFSFKKEFFLIVLYDALFYLSVFLIALIFSFLLKFQMEKLGLTNLGGLNLADQQVIQSNVNLAQVLIASMIVYFVLFLLIALISYSFFKGIVWLTMLNKKPSFGYFKKFFLTNLIWWGVWIIPAVLALFGLKQEYFTLVFVLEAILYFHLTSILHLSFAKSQDIKRSFSKILPVGFGKIHHFIIPYVYALIVYIVLSQIFRIIPQQQRVVLSTAILLALLYLAWFRNYVKEVIPQNI